MKYCSHCARPVVVEIPPGDSLPRHVCRHCGRIFYKNPRLVVGTLPRRDGRILLCKRSIEPRRGYWTLPCGFMENHETLEEGALRETREEAPADYELGPLHALFSLPHVSQVYAIFLAELRTDEVAAGEETSEVLLVRQDQIPWPRIAFRAIEFALQRFCAAPEEAGRQVHVGSHASTLSGAWIEAEEDD